MNQECKMNSPNRKLKTSIRWTVALITFIFKVMYCLIFKVLSGSVREGVSFYVSEIEPKLDFACDPSLFQLKKLVNTASKLIHVGNIQVFLDIILICLVFVQIHKWKTTYK